MPSTPTPDFEEAGGARLDQLTLQGSLGGVSHSLSAAAMADGDVFLSPVGGIPGALSEKELRFTTKDGQHLSRNRSVREMSPTPVRGFGCELVVRSDHDSISPARLVAGSRRAFKNRRNQRGTDPQDLYPASSCIFVANLPERLSDQTLEAAVTKIFSQFGTVFIKIKRDPRNMPHAFCQYTTDQDATEAVTKGRGEMIYGRPCRTEMARANRTFHVSRRDRTDITLEEVRSFCEPFGALEKVEFMLDQFRLALRLPKTAVVVTFSLLRIHRDMATMMNDPEYRVDKFDPERLFQNGPNADERYLQQYDVDRRTAYFGNLNESVSERDIRVLAGDVGRVHKVHMIHKEHPTSGMNHFAFVEFARADMPDTAIARYNGNMFHDLPLRVERKATGRVRDQPKIGSEGSLQRLLPAPEAAQEVKESPATPTDEPYIAPTSDSKPVHQPQLYVPTNGYTAPQFGVPGFGQSPFGLSPYHGAPYGAPMTPATTPGMVPYGMYPSPYIYQPFATEGHYHAFRGFDSPVPILPRSNVDANGSPMPTRHSKPPKSQQSQGEPEQQVNSSGDDA